MLSYDPNVRLPLWPSPEAAREGIKSIWEEADFVKVSDDEVAFLAHGDANDENNVLSLWYDGRVNGFPVKTVDTTGAGDAFVGDFFLPYQRMKLTPHTDMVTTSRLKVDFHNLGRMYAMYMICNTFSVSFEISPGNVAAYFGLASRLLGLSKECVNNGAFSWGASLLEETSDVANASTVLTGKCFLHLELAYVKCVPWTNEQWTSDTIEMAYITSISSWTNKRLIRISAKAESAIYAQPLSTLLCPRYHNSVSLSGAITTLQAVSLRLPVNENVRVDIEELEGALNSTSNVIETMSSHFRSFLPKAEEIVEAFASNRSPTVRDGMNLTPYEYIV
ncbi:hypothetical protein GIB67_026890 [Kingdonia uniflora]|uniref:Carbohydrate kinase PfkB domain-containing protein n=1 Tax=Kingdonia uniflora TaxID=39325 RepID=A0A7J7M7W2_9MAGN|nr:hypothetical protein GIB67_026890 [Kingdonia uniflora]